MAQHADCKDWLRTRLDKASRRYACRETGTQAARLSCSWQKRQSGHTSLLPCAYVKHLHNVETSLYRPQTFLSLDFQCRDDISELDRRFVIEKSYKMSYYPDGSTNNEYLQRQNEQHAKNCPVCIIQMQKISTQHQRRQLCCFAEDTTHRVSVDGDHTTNQQGISVSAGQD